MISKEVKINLKNANSKVILNEIFDIDNLPKLWKYLQKVEKIDSISYIAEFKVFMRFRFLMKREISEYSVVHYGVMKFPKASFTFSVNVIPLRDESLDMIVRGDYQGPLERLAGSPMQSFLNNFVEKFSNKIHFQTFENFTTLINEGIEQSKNYDGKIKISVDECEAFFENGKIVEITCGRIKDDDAMKELSSKKIYNAIIDYL